LRDDLIPRLFQAIRRYGLDNLSTLSKWTGIHVESARYMIWKELPKRNIEVGVSVNLASIGLSRWLLEFKSTNKTYAQPILNALRNNRGGLLYTARQVPENSSFAVIAIPFGEDFKLRKELESLSEAGIIEHYSLEEIEWMCYLSFDPTFYDFNQRRWRFKWSDLDGRKEPPLTPYTKGGPIQVDYEDIMILKEFTEKVPRTISKLSRDIKLPHYNVRYHYINHARLAIEGYYVKLMPSVKNQPLKFVYEIANERSLIEAKTVATSIPFTSCVWKTEKTYGWTMYCPEEHISGLLNYVNQKFMRIPGRLRLLMVDRSSEYYGSIPYQLFDELSGKWCYSPKIAFVEPQLERHKIKKI
jgi:hypothetical protein